MRTKIVKIGNSQGIRIPKVLLEQSLMTDEVELEAQPRQIIIRPVREARFQWTEAFQEMAQNGDDALLDEGEASQTAWDREEWDWA
ncbi:MAG: AbrB/MazE/SpoVT family DNA-binding domain-containing protein [Blastocatellia bacterium]|nr:AbrB/MazE/SpoVT family DNA-binding domain-containing protein [Blastocatellia bacterium]